MKLSWTFHILTTLQIGVLHAANTNNNVIDNLLSYDPTRNHVDLKVSRVDAGV